MVTKRQQFFAIKSVVLFVIICALLSIGLSHVQQANAAVSQFSQGSGYQPGAYDLNAAQPTAFNWMRRSRFTGSAVANKKWEFATNLLDDSSPAIGPDGIIYVGSSYGDSNNKLYAINPDGSQKWAFATGRSIGSSPALGADGTIYIGSHDGKLYAINSDGSKKWEFATGDMINKSSPALGADGTIYIGSCDDKLYAINPNGSKKWEFTAGGEIYSSPALGADGTIYVGSFDKKLYAINPNGSKKWEFATDGNVMSSPALGADGTIYVGSICGKLYAINADGSKKWEFATGHYIQFSSPAIGLDGTIYIGSWDNKLYAINSDGSKKWEYATGGIVEASPVLGAEGTIYIGSCDDKLHAINADGTKKWEFVTGSNVYASPALGADGTIYIGSCDGNLYAIGEQYLPTFTITTNGTTVTAGDVAEISVISSEPLQETPEVKVEINSGTPINVPVSYVEASGVYMGTYQTSITEIGQVTITVTGADMDGNIGSGISYFYIINQNHFNQGSGYQSGAYDLNAAQPTAFNWTRQSIFTGSAVADKKWEFATEYDITNSSPALGSDGTIYVGSCDHKLYATNPDGSKRWEFVTEGNVFSPVIGLDGTIYVGSTDGKLYSINPDGSKKWDFTTYDSIASSCLAIGADGTIYVGISQSLYALTINLDGSKKWNFFTSGFIKSSPAIGSDGTIYIGSTDKKLYAINPDGSKKWEFITGGAIYSSPALGSDGTIYVGSFDKKLYAINPDGSKKWEFVAGYYINDSSPAIGLDGTIYIGSLDGKLHAINMDGSKKWEFVTGAGINSSPVLGADGTIYVGSGDKKLYAINWDGSKKWEFTTEGVIDSSPAIGSDGTIYVGSGDYKLYAVGEHDTTPPTFTITPSITTVEAGNAIEISVISSEPLQEAPIVTVELTGGVLVNILLSYNEATGAYLGTYQTNITETGQVTITLTGTDMAGNSGTGSAQCTIVNQTGNLVHFNDPNLESAVREALDKPTGEITEADMTGLTSLSADSRAIQDLTGLEYATNLVGLSLMNNQITDISILTSLTNLGTLYLDNNQITDISVLAHLNNLYDVLSLRNNKISDISALVNLSDLITLYLDNNQISDISVLMNLTNLQKLYLGTNQISDITVITNLTTTRFLYLENNQITDISILKNLPDLQILWLQNNYLNISEGSQARTDIQTIITNGVTVEYEPQNTPPDATPPTVSVTDPADNAVAGLVNNDITVIFNEEVQEGVNFDNITLKDTNGNSVEITKSINSNKLIINASAGLSYNTQYAVTIPTNAVKDMANNSLENDFSFNFTTKKGIALFIDPVSQQVKEGERISINVMAGNVQDLASADIWLYFDPAVLRAFEDCVTVGQDVYGLGTVYYYNEDREGRGWVRFASAGVGEYGFTGDAHLATVSFDVYGSGTSEIYFGPSKLINVNFELIEINSTNAAVVMSSGNSSLQGLVCLQGLSDCCGVKVELFQLLKELVEGEEVIKYIRFASTTTGAGGLYSFSGLSAGEYILQWDKPTFLRGHSEVFTLGMNEAREIETVTLRSGDVDLDNQVTFNDLLQLAGVYGNIKGENSWRPPYEPVPWNANADLNKNDEIDLFDLVLLARNYNNRGFSDLTSL